MYPRSALSSIVSAEDVYSLDGPLPLLARWEVEPPAGPLTLDVATLQAPFYVWPNLTYVLPSRWTPLTLLPIKGLHRVHKMTWAYLYNSGYQVQDPCWRTYQEKYTHVVLCLPHDELLDGPHRTILSLRPDYQPSIPSIECRQPQDRDQTFCIKSCAFVSPPGDSTQGRRATAIFDLMAVVLSSSPLILLQGSSRTHRVSGFNPSNPWTLLSCSSKVVTLYAVVLVKRFPEDGSQDSNGGGDFTLLRTCLAVHSLTINVSESPRGSAYRPSNVLPTSRSLVLAIGPTTLTLEGLAKLEWDFPVNSHRSNSLYHPLASCRPSSPSPLTRRAAPTPRLASASLRTSLFSRLGMNHVVDRLLFSLYPVAPASAVTASTKS
ncbi:hypothetical protein OG21DRAFT_1524106 [Imleria badia]|nr:hypothetical protein OG21DRAFT_1524106 [Imleria badia]